MTFEAVELMVNTVPKADNESTGCGDLLCCTDCTDGHTCADSHCGACTGFGCTNNGDTVCQPQTDRPFPVPCTASCVDSGCAASGCADSCDGSCDGSGCDGSGCEDSGCADSCDDSGGDTGDTGHKASGTARISNLQAEMAAMRSALNQRMTPVTNN